MPPRAANGPIVVNQGSVHSQRAAADEQAAALAGATAAAAATHGLIRFEYAVVQDKHSAGHIDAATGRQSPTAAATVSLPSRATYGLI